MERIEHGTVVGAYDPFLDVICDIFRKEIKGDFNEFLTQCNVYELHREEAIVMVVNRFQMASRSTMHLVRLLIEENILNLGIVLGVNESQIRKDSRLTTWEKITEELGDLGQIYHIGSSGNIHSENYNSTTNTQMDYDQILLQLKNIIELLDLATCYMYQGKLDIAYPNVKMA